MATPTKKFSAASGAASSASPSHKEIEIKLRVPDVNALRRKLKKLGARVIASEAAAKDGRVHEWNTLYDTPQGGFARHGQLLRIREESAGSAGPTLNTGKREARCVLTYKGPAEQSAPASRHKVREEIEADISDPAPMARILEALGLRGWFHYEKFRTTFSFPAKAAWAKGLLIELDETPSGDFIELEGPAEAIDRAAKELGYSEADYITKSYLALHIEICAKQGKTIAQLAPGVVTGIPDMVFPEGKKSR
jgi:adenylate cyclase, class 2